MGAERILLVDDDAALVQALRHRLDEAGFSVLATSEGQEALAHIHTFAPAVVVLDVWLPGMDGIETLHALQAMQADVEVIVMSGHGNIATAVHVTKLGAFDYLEKPCTPARILATIREALAHRQLRQQPMAATLLPAGSLTTAMGHVGYRQATPPTLLHAADRPSPRQRAVLPPPRRAFVPQRTLQRSVVLHGQGLQSGLQTGLILSPMPPHSGILFRHITTGATIPAAIECIASTDFCTSLQHDGTVAHTIEHLMSALHAYRITNVLIKLHDEVPIMDGSAAAFCQGIEDAGIAEQDAVVEEFVVDRCYSVGQVHSEAKFILVEPYDGFRVTYRLNYPPPLGVQEFSYEHTDGVHYAQAIAPARTFGFVRDVEKMHELGLLAGGRLTNVVLIGDEHIINSAPLRFPDECVRHKILDIMGDLYLLGTMVRGHVRANMTGHTENAALVQQLRAAMSLR